jgi:hypothetical protein
MIVGHVDPTKEAFAEFRAHEREGPIHMLNLVRLRAQAHYPDGRSATGAEAYAAYGRESLPVFVRLGGRIVWRGRFEQMRSDLLMNAGTIALSPNIPPCPRSSR